MDHGQETGITNLLVTGAVREPCRAVGTTAFAVLADVALDAEFDAQGILVADTNVRRIADHLGISKDGAARALVRLAGAGLVVRRRPGRGAGGRFVPSAYELRLGSEAGVAPSNSLSGLESPCPAPEDRQGPPRSASPGAAREDGRSDVAASRPRRSRRSSRVDQQSLFDLASESAERQ